MVATMTRDEQSTQARRPAFRLEPAPYDLRRPLDPPPERIRKDPRIPDQHRTAFWVEVNGQRVGRVVLVEFDDRAGWWYQPEVSMPGEKLPRPFSEPLAKRQDAVDEVIEEWRKEARAARRSGARAG
jgi:hypothetical protein